MRPTASYQEFAPTPALSRHLQCIWVQSVGDGKGAFLQRVLPDGCADILWIDDLAPMVVGPATRAAVVPLKAGQQIVAARIRPGAVNAVLGIAALELRDRQLPLREILGVSARRLESVRAHGCHRHQRREAVERVLHAHIGDAPTPNGRFLAAVAEVADIPNREIFTLASRLGVGERQMRRLFHDSVGFGPKTFHRICRFQRLRKQVTAAQPSVESLAELAAASGYADQPHMTREVTALAGIAPARFLSIAAHFQSISDQFE